ncbi:hypothetical protein GCM10010909_06910 [Acidocella aquatica]|uniref:Terminase small subunit n=1 Tax=Acidocella aquatica TaxID=1922313 RepID=A0ABQ6A3U1_9PROT|nr:hypothetical protein [Acidocella aquatica]GLR66013.1 hypothetical protein GCM10010909_06910 [Acidocella aquatica]
MSDDASLLPEGFADLEPFVTDWAITTMKARLHRRVTSTARERRGFYAAMAPRAQAALDYLNPISLDDISKKPETDRLMKLILSLAEIALTEEINGQEVEAEHARSNRQIFMVKELDEL